MSSHAAYQSNPIGTAESSAACEARVKEEYPTANGATWGNSTVHSPNHGLFYAVFHGQGLTRCQGLEHPDGTCRHGSKPVTWSTCYFTKPRPPAGSKSPATTSMFTSTAAAAVPSTTGASLSAPPAATPRLLVGCKFYCDCNFGCKATIDLTATGGGIVGGPGNFDSEADCMRRRLRVGPGWPR